jgi:tRNA (guanine37-N1)-methyltransferase
MHGIAEARLAISFRRARRQCMPLHSDPKLTIHIVSLFPQLFDSWLQQGVVSRAIEQGLVQIQLTALRDFGVGRHQLTDDYPFGGGPGMVMKPEPLFDAVDSLGLPAEVPVILLSPHGTRFDQRTAERLSIMPRIALIAGHYEGVDDRVRQHLATEDISIGDYVLSCGELAAMVVADAVVRLLPGALAEGSASDESFSEHLLEYPQYTRPARFRGWEVPDVLVSGHHGEIARWRRLQALRQTYSRRPDLLEEADLSAEEQQMVERWKEESGQK